MRQAKSERLKKLEKELADLEQWQKLGLVPKKDIEKHKEEIAAVQEKIRDEQERLQFLRESGDLEEYMAATSSSGKRSSQRSGFNTESMPTLPDVEMTDTAVHDTHVEATSEATLEEEDRQETTQEDDTFSERQRWKRVVDPESDDDW